VEKLDPDQRDKGFQMTDDLFDEIVNDAKKKLEKDDVLFVFSVNSKDDSVIYHGGKGCPGCIAEVLAELINEGEFPHNAPATVSEGVH